MTTFSAPRAPSASTAGIGIVVDTAQMKTLAAALRRSPAPVRKAALLALRTQAKAIMADAGSRAGFSKRIPASMKIKGSGLRLKGIAGGDTAPDAAPIENKGKGFVRHPTYGHMDRWTSKNSHPAYLGPALDAHRGQLLDVVEAAVYEATLKAVKSL